MSCTIIITDAEKAKRYDLIAELKETYSASFFIDKAELLFERDFEPLLVDEIVTMMKRDVERWSK